MTIGGAAAESQVNEIRHTQRLLEGLADTVTLYAHDHTGYQLDVIEPFLADGAYSAEERWEIEAYRSGVFTDNWRLRQDNAPRFVPPESEESTGSVGLR